VDWSAQAFYTLVPEPSAALLLAAPLAVLMLRAGRGDETSP